MAPFTPPTGPPQDALGRVVLFQAPDGQVSLDVHLEADIIRLVMALLEDQCTR